MKKTKKSNITKRAGTGCIFVVLMAVQSQFVALEQSTYTYLYISFIWDGFSFDLGSTLSLFHWSVLPRLVISSNHMESLFCLLHNRLIQCHFYCHGHHRVVLLFKGSLARVGHSAVSLDSLFSRPSRFCQSHVLSHQICLIFRSCWFEKVSIDFLLAGLSLIDYDTLL